VMRSTALALGLGFRLSVVAAEVGHDGTPERETTAEGDPVVVEVPVRHGRTETTVEPSILDRTASAVHRLHLAQFVIPKKPEKGQPAGTQLPSRLTYQYGYGSESDVVYRRNDGHIGWVDPPVAKKEPSTH